MSRVARIWIEGVWNTLRSDPWWDETIEKMARYEVDRVRGVGFYASELTEMGRESVREQMAALLNVVAGGER